jgi:DNA-binding response OmpR family regulator
MNPTTPSTDQQFKAILVVDDDRELVDALRTALMNENFLVDVAYDGEEAFLKAKIQQYDGIVCDLKMPRLPGDEFYRQATELRPELASRFLFITGYGKEEAVREFLKESPVRYLLKPFTIQQLIASVRDLLS